MGSNEDVVFRHGGIFRSYCSYFVASLTSSIATPVIIMSMMKMVMSTMMTMATTITIAEGLTQSLEGLPRVSSFPEQRLFAPESVLLWPGKAIADTSTVEEIPTRPDRT